MTKLDDATLAWLAEGLREYTLQLYGPQPPVPLGVRLLEPGDGVPMAWKFAAYIEQLREKGK